MLNPVFSINHMREMVPTFHDISSRLSATLNRVVSGGRKEIEIFDGFGHSFDSLTEDQKEHPYMTAVKQLSPLFWKTAILQAIVLPVVHKWNLGGRAFQRWVMGNLTWGSLRTMKRIVDIMDDTSQDIYQRRKKVLETGGVLDGSGKDILTILMRSNMESSEQDKLPDHEIIAQITTFVFAGMDTTTGALCRLLSLLAEHQDVQDRLRQEIRDAKAKHGQLDYDQLVALPYLDAVCRETLRLDGRELVELVIPVGTTVFVSRWLSDLPKNLVDAKVPGVYSHLACIGFKFSQLELNKQKAVALHLLDRLKFTLTD
ncbi:cytochrome P450 [Coprinopsis sp. MPI-PUGE-AT-0042]|nr:cytochrome P450 [Coprinopsis sp. MPI-PUGE-AT-0042]